MPSLIFVKPDMAHYALTPDKYAALVAALKTDKDASNLRIDDPNTGTVTYQQIDFGWTYDGAAQLTVVIVKDRNWKARIAGNELIFSELNDQLISKV